MKKTFISLAVAGALVAPSADTYSLNSELYELVPAPIVEYSVGQVYFVDDKMMLNQRNLDCLTKNIYFEAAHRQVSRLSIAQVTVNRLEAGKWGNDLCAVVLAKKQFSWTHLTDHKINDKARWQASLESAKDYLNGARVKGLESVLYYHVDYIQIRSWAKKMTVVFRDSGHLFFKENVKNESS